MEKVILVTGGGGYIGSVLVELLLENGFKVRIVDRFFFGPTFQDHKKLEVIKKDTRNISTEDLHNVFAILDLAAISNDPAGELDAVKTLDINYRARRRLQELASESGVEKYVLASSCSVYGFQDGFVNEDSLVNPLTTYAEANIRAENSALEIFNQGSDMSITIFRQATMYGLSPRMRFDLAINGMTLGMWKNGIIPLLRDGKQWRPMIHIRDTSKSFLAVLNADIDKINGQTFNVGSNEQNFQIENCAKLVAEGLNKPFKFEWYGDVDHRSYQVDFTKIKTVLGFSPDWIPVKGAAEIADALEAGRTVADERTKTVSWYSTLLEWDKKIKDIAPDGFVL